MQNKIFIAIASYLDYEIKYTILDCIEKGRFPENLTFSVCLQYDAKKGTSKNCIDGLQKVCNIKIDKFKYTESKGGCWARNIAQKNYNNEEYTLQVDSHTRFAKDWDVDILNDYNLLRLSGIKKPLLTFLPPSYFRDDKKDIDTEFTFLDKLTHLNIPKIRSISNQYWPEYGGYVNIKDTKNKPVSISLLYGGFIFSKGQWVVEVEQDPFHYYTGEEFALALRSFTNGYDLFTPSKVIAWHRSHPYTPKKHFNNNEEIKVHKFHNIAMQRLKKLVFKEDLGKYGLGNERTLEDYEKFSQIDIKNRKVNHV